MKAEIIIHNLDKLTSKTKVVEEKEGDEIVGRKLVTTITFDCEASPGAIGQIASLMRQGCPIDCTIGSKQAIMEFGLGIETAGVN
ncbi:MAG: hypothetical protein P3T54_00055 [Dehalogenimonas sp.]|nr:hypothetical protein [Dehalogenimonas sp.]